MGKKNSKDFGPHDVAKLMEKQVDKMMQVAGDYKTAINASRTAVDKLESYQKKPWVVYKKYVVAGIAIVALVAAFTIYRVFSHDCSASFQSSIISFKVQERGCDVSK